MMGYANHLCDTCMRRVTEFCSDPFKCPNIERAVQPEKETTMTTRWWIETSHMVAVPKYYDVEDTADLRRQVQATADSKTRLPRMGEISFRFELNGRDQPVKVHCYFTNKHDKKVRFMRLGLTDPLAAHRPGGKLASPS